MYKLNEEYIDVRKHLYQSEGFPRTGYFIPAHVGAGAGQVWRVLPPAPSGQFFGKKRGFQKVRLRNVCEDNLTPYF